MGKKVGSALELAKIATPANPASGYVALYVKSDDQLYVKTSGGTETLVTGTGGGGSAPATYTDTFMLMGA